MNILFLKRFLFITNAVHVIIVWALTAVIFPVGVLIFTYVVGKWVYVGYVWTHWFIVFIYVFLLFSVHLIQSNGRIWRSHPDWPWAKSIWIKIYKSTLRTRRMCFSPPCRLHKHGCLLFPSQAINLPIAYIYWSGWDKQCNLFSFPKRQI